MSLSAGLSEDAHSARRSRQAGLVESPAKRHTLDVLVATIHGSSMQTAQSKQAATGLQVAVAPPSGSSAPGAAAARYAASRKQRQYTEEHMRRGLRMLLCQSRVVPEEKRASIAAVAKLLGCPTMESKVCRPHAIPAHLIDSPCSTIDSPCLCAVASLR